MVSAEMKQIKVGDRIPEFILKDQDGNLFDISTLIGKKMLVIFFYPQDEGLRCTKQACHFRDLYDDFIEAGAEIIGISGQSVESHKSFAENHNLSYRILSDDGDNVRRKLFGVPGSLFGLLPGRVTYIVDLEGTVVYIFNSQLRVEKHVDEALKILFLMKTSGKKLIQPN
jgi:peroxiredoxin Q/BCP